MSTVWPEHFLPPVVDLNHGSSVLSSVCIAHEAWRRGLEVTFFGRDLENYAVSDGMRTVEFNCARPQSLTSLANFDRINSKLETTKMLRRHGIPVPDGRAFMIGKTSPQELTELAAEIGYPVVIKPSAGSMGIGVYAELQSPEALVAAYADLERSRPGRAGLLEKHHPGEDYRVLVAGSDVVGVAHRVPAHVVGDGASTISQLIATKNKHRRQNPFLSGGLIRVDYEVNDCLVEQGLRLEDTPEKDRHVYLRRKANASAGGDVIDVTDEIPDEVKRGVVQAVAAAPGIVVAGVDVIYDKGNPGRFVIIEMNVRPHIGVNMYPSQGVGRDAPKGIIDTVFPGTARPEAQEVKALRFDVAAIEAALFAGAASRVTVSPLPTHFFPYRKRMLYRSDAAAAPLNKPRQRALQRIAGQGGVVGQVRRIAGEGVELLVAAEDKASTLPLISRANSYFGGEPEAINEWSGTVTTSFTIDL